MTLKCKACDASLVRSDPDEDLCIDCLKHIYAFDPVLNPMNAHILMESVSLDISAKEEEAK